MREKKKINQFELDFIAKFCPEIKTPLNYIYNAVHTKGERKGVFVERDITARKNLELKYALISENAVDLIAIMDETFNYKYINDLQHRKILGYSTEDLLGNSGIRLMHPNDVRRAIKEMKKALKIGEINIEIRIRHKDGHYLWFETRGKPFKNIDGKLNSIIISRNITKRKIIEEKMAKQNGKIHLLQDLFIHDMGNILQNLKLSLGLTKICKDSLEKQEEMLKIFEEQVYRGISLVNTTRKYIMIEKNEIKEDKERLNLGFLLIESRKFIENSFPTKTIQILIDSNVDNMFVFGNKLLIEVFENILGNAVKYNNSDIIVITIVVKKIEDQITIRFSDNGIGIPSNKKEDLFKPLSKSYSLGKGMGIGLNIIKKILENHNGKIWHEDRIKGDYSKGSNFVVQIPSYEQKTKN